MRDSIVKNNQSSPAKQQPKKEEVAVSPTKQEAVPSTEKVIQKSEGLNADQERVGTLEIEERRSPVREPIKVASKP